MLPTITFPFDSGTIPKNGIYVLFETSETAHGTNRIVRIGSHTGNGQLPSRLHQHFLNENKDRSIFRKNIGRALLNKIQDPFLPHWNIDLTTREARARHSKLIDFAKQELVEKQVTEYMRKHFSFSFISVPNRTARLRFETKLIATVSQCQICKSSTNWLGHYSPIALIRAGKLWQVKDLGKAPLTNDEFEKLSMFA